MSRAEFESFVQRKQEEKAETAPFDAKKELAEWHEHLHELYSRIGGFLKDYVDRQAASIEFDPIEINEQFSGPYEVDRMLLHIGAATIVFKPIGTMLIGSKGGVDVIGPQGSARLGLVNKAITHARQLVQVKVSLRGDRPSAPEASPAKIEWVWKIITRPPDLKFVELNEENFFDMILGVADA